MRRIELFLILIIIVILSGCFSIGDKKEDKDDPYKYGKYEITFERYNSTKNEMMAIQIAEGINYSDCLNISRFDGFYANYIDSETFIFYNTTFLKDKNEGREADLFYEYLAYGKSLKKNTTISIFNSEMNINFLMNGEIFINDYNASYLNVINILDSIISVYNNGSWNIIKDINDPWKKDFQYNTQINGGYIVGMILEYDDIWANTGAIYVHTQQMIILDRNYQPVVVMCNPSEHLVS